MTMTGLEGDIATAYRNFATREARGNSPAYEAICLRIAANDEVLALIATLPDAKRQPNLVLAAARHLGAPTDDDAAFVAWLVAQWDDVRTIALQRATQTNEVGRCATLLPFIAHTADSAGRDIALLEVGCSAGLTLFPDLYGYEFVAPGDPTGLIRLLEPEGDGAPTLTCRVGAPARSVVTGIDHAPSIAWRGGLDLNPLDVLSQTDDARENARWLRSLVWPGQEERAARLDSAIETVRHHVTACPQDAPHVVAGDVVDDLDRLLAQVPDDLHLVMFHSAVLAYVADDKRHAFEARMAALAERHGGFTWISNEAPSVMRGVRVALHEHDIDVPAGRFVLAVDGLPRAVTGPHGQSLDLLRPDAV